MDKERFTTLQDIYVVLGRVLGNPERYNIVQYEADRGTSEMVNAPPYNRIACNMVFIDKQQLEGGPING